MSSKHAHAVHAFTAEVLAIHASCDRAAIPRELDEDDLPLSVSERVAIMTLAYTSLVAAKEVIARCAS